MSLRRFQYPHDRNLPFVPITLSYADHMIQREALLDSGSTNNLMPYQVGLDLGLSWDAQTLKLPSEDVFEGAPVVGIRVFGRIKPFPPIPLVFAWVKNDTRPLILGHMNFFLAFDVHFYDAEGFFELAPSVGM